MAHTDTVVARIADILETYADTTVITYEGSPRGIEHANLPAWVILTKPATYDYENVGMSDTVAITQQYQLMLLVQTWQVGTELETEELVRPYIDWMRTEFIGRPSLENPKGQNPLTYVQNAKLTGDSGVINIILQGTGFAGITFDLELLEMYTINFA